MVTSSRFPKAHWVHLRSDDISESPLAALRLKTDTAEYFRKAKTAKAVTLRMPVIAEKKHRRVNGKELPQEVYLQN